MAKEREERRHKEFLDYRKGKQRSFYLPKGKLQERVEDPLAETPYTFLETEETLSDTFGYMSPEKWKQIQKEYPKYADILYEDLSEKDKWGEYKHWVNQIPGTPADRYGWDLMGKVAEVGGVANIAEGGRVSYFNGGIAGLLKK